MSEGGFGLIGGMWMGWDGIIFIFIDSHGVLVLDLGFIPPCAFLSMIDR